MSWMPTVDIVIPCYNVAHIVEQCVKSLLKQSYHDNTVSIYLINDGSSDSTGRILESFSNESHVKIIHLDENKGLSAARNAGIKAGSGDVICFLDSDMTVQSEWVNAHLDLLSQENIVGVIGESLLPEDQTPNELDCYLYDPRRGARSIGEGTPIPFSYFLFNNTSVRRSVFDVIELFDEKITTYGGEDTELAIRFWEAYPDGLRFSSYASCIHHHPRELNDFCNSMYSYGKTNLPSLLEQFPQYKTELGGGWLSSIKGHFLFNSIIRWFVSKISLYFSNYWLTRYKVIDAVIRGARSIYSR